jgi:Ca2+:H+ antiporter
MSLYHRLLNMPSGLPTHYRRSESMTRRSGSLQRKASVGTTTTNGSIRDRRHRHSQSNSRVRSGDGIVRAPLPINTSTANDQQQNPPSHITLPASPSVPRRLGALPPGYAPIVEQVARATKAAVDPMALPQPTMTVTQTQTDPVSGYTTQGQTRLNITTDEFTRAVAVATVSALRQGVAADAAAAGQARRVGGAPAPASGLYDSHQSAGGGGGHGGHDAPSWSRAVSATVLLGCTLLYAVIAGQLYLQIPSPSFY